MPDKLGIGVCVFSGRGGGGYLSDWSTPRLYAGLVLMRKRYIYERGVRKVSQYRCVT